MTTQEKYDDGRFDFSCGEFDSAIGKFKALLHDDPSNFEARLALGMAFYRKEDFNSAIAEGLKAEALRPREQLVHTNLSLFYMKAGDKVNAEKHGLQAKIESWRDEAARTGVPTSRNENNTELTVAKSTPQPIKFPSQPWKKSRTNA